MRTGASLPRRRAFPPFLLPTLLLTLLTLAATAPVVSASPLTERRAQAREVARQVEELDRRFSIAVEEYNLASIRLEAVRQQIKRNGRRLAMARFDLAAAKAQLSRRVVSLYKQRPTDLLDVLLQTRTLDEFLTELSYVTALGRSDAELVATIRAYEREIRAKRSQLVVQRRDARRLVAQRAQRKRAIATELQVRKRRLAGVEREVEQLEAIAARAAQRAAERAAQQAAESTANQPPQAVGGVSSAAGVGHPEAVAIARRYLGIPYRWGGASPSTGFDCSGFTMYVYAQLGISLPHAASQQYNYGTKVARSDLQPGDLVFFGPSAAGIYHVGIYAGSGSMIDAPNTGSVVRYDPLGSSYFGAVRL